MVGGTGFIGRHFCEAIQRAGLEGQSISPNPDLKFLSTNAPSVRGVLAGAPEISEVLRSADSVVYFAHRSRPASQIDGPRGEIETNLIDACAFAERLFALNPAANLIYLSSGGQIYGRNHSAPISEDAPTMPVTPYGLGKKLVEDLLSYFHTTFGARIEVLRLGNPVGRWQLNTSHGLVSAAVAAAKTGRPLTIFGEGRNRRDYFDADDLASFLVEQIRDDQVFSGVFNIGSGHGLSELEVVDAVEATLGTTLDVRREPARSFDLPYSVLNVDRARETLGWRATTPLEVTIQKVADACTP
ncbi:hypothetical protein DDZ18_03640 [Marinicauda salina]|uniref:NAD-dependent epimerase/dehydratase domain-containing protein n=1 Tax=Marinicauda salina TaxID=2135793 RepID=A0A2U2BXF8_9PROT|nr:NAD-dependent epimerase/dehydratase family protein [Marinicauda salina]PWE18696.1 hypothetical protein DDZ18_03640 [Marinicauda salina]